MRTVREALQLVQQNAKLPSHQLRHTYQEIEKSLSEQDVRSNPDEAVELYSLTHAITGQNSKVLGPVIQSPGFISGLNYIQFRKLISILCRKSANFHSWSLYSEIESELCKRLKTSMDISLVSGVLGMLGRRKILPTFDSLREFEKVITLRWDSCKRTEHINDILLFYSQTRVLEQPDNPNADNMKRLIYTKIAPNFYYLANQDFNSNSLISALRSMIILDLPESPFWKQSLDVLRAKLAITPHSNSTIALSIHLGLLRTLDALRELAPKVVAENAQAVDELEKMLNYSESYIRKSETVSKVQQQVHLLAKQFVKRVEFESLVEKYYLVDMQILRNIIQVDGSTHYVRRSLGTDTNILCGKDYLQDRVLMSKGYVIKRIPIAVFERNPKRTIETALKELGLV